MEDNAPITIPEYNPKKFKKAFLVAKAVSRILVLVMAIGAVLLIGTFLLNENTFVVNVNGIPTRDFSGFLIATLSWVAVWGLLSIFAYLLSFRLKYANAIYAEPDAEKRAAMVLRPEYIKNNQEKDDKT